MKQCKLNKKCTVQRGKCLEKLQFWLSVLLYVGVDWDSCSDLVLMLIVCVICPSRSSTFHPAWLCYSDVETHESISAFLIIIGIVKLCAHPSQTSLVDPRFTLIHVITSNFLSLVREKGVFSTLVLGLNVYSTIKLLEHTLFTWECPYQATTEFSDVDLPGLVSGGGWTTMITSLFRSQSAVQGKKLIRTHVLHAILFNHWIIIVNIYQNCNCMVAIIFIRYRKE